MLCSCLRTLSTASPAFHSQCPATSRVLKTSHRSAVCAALVALAYVSRRQAGDASILLLWLPLHCPQLDVSTVTNAIRLAHTSRSCMSVLGPSVMRSSVVPSWHAAFLTMPGFMSCPQPGRALPSPLPRPFPALHRPLPRPFPALHRPGAGIAKSCWPVLVPRDGA